MIYLTLTIIAIPLLAMLWAAIGLLLHRRTARRHEWRALLGTFLMLPLGILHIGVMEMGVRWLMSLEGLAFGSVTLVGLVVFIRAEIAKSRDRSRPQWACPGCGYDRRGIVGPCPECGMSGRPEGA